MDEQLVGLFNNGSNQGDLTIISSDNVKIQCHSFILMSTTEFDISEKEIKLNYHSSIIRIVLNKIYNSSYQFTQHLEIAGKPNDEPIYKTDMIFDIFDLVIEMKIITYAKFRNELVSLLDYSINNQNWQKILEKILDYQSYKFLIDFIVDKAKIFLDGIEKEDLPLKIFKPLERYFIYYPIIASKPDSTFKYIVNKSKWDYLRIDDNNSKEVCDSIVFFLKRNKVWYHYQTINVQNYKPVDNYRNIKYMLRFYKKEYERENQKIN